MTQLFRHLTLDFSSGHDLTVHGIEPQSGSALPAWSLLGILSLLLPLNQLCSPQEGPVGPIAQHCPMEGSGSVPGPHEHQPPHHLGLTITMFSPCCPHHALLPCSGRRKPKDLEVGVGEGFSLSPLPSPHAPYSPAQRDAAHTRKDY